MPGTSMIVLATLNARYSHASFGLRYLWANMGELQEQTRLLEFVINDVTLDVAARILAHRPRILGLGVYIWNVDQMTRLVADLKRMQPDLIIVLGGPEVSYECDELPLVRAADYVITGEGDLAFRELCEQILNGNRPQQKFLPAALPTFAQLRLPYDAYSEEDIAHRTVYVEVSRGCPFTCEFCLSSLEIPVRLASLEAFLDAMQKLLDRGARQFKFVDRTFNLNTRVSRGILEFFWQRYFPGMFLHFEMIPDRLPDTLREWIARFPAGSIQLEIGVQTFNDQVGERIRRKQDNEKLEENFRFLRSSTGAHIHADLIVGLPGESLESFANGFDRLCRLKPQEIQVGILKRLRGTPIQRHDQEWQMVYSPHAPYEILSTRLLNHETIQFMRRFARYWDMIANSGNFVLTLERLLASEPSAFWQFAQLSEWLFARDPRIHGISLADLSAAVFEFLVERSSGTIQFPPGSRAFDFLERLPEIGDAFREQIARWTQPEVASTDTVSVEQIRQEIAECLWSDYTRHGRRDRPAFLRPFALTNVAKPRSIDLPARQRRHLA